MPPNAEPLWFAIASRSSTCWPDLFISFNISVFPVPVIPPKTIIPGCLLNHSNAYRRYDLYPPLSLYVFIPICSKSQAMLLLRIPPRQQCTNIFLSTAISRALLAKCFNFGPIISSPSKKDSSLPLFAYDVPIFTLSSSENNAIFIDPGIWPLWYSAGERTSITGIVLFSVKNWIISISRDIFSKNNLLNRLSFIAYYFNICRTYNMLALVKERYILSFRYKRYSLEKYKKYNNIISITIA